LLCKVELSDEDFTDARSWWAAFAAALATLPQFRRNGIEHRHFFARFIQTVQVTKPSCNGNSSAA
jgi:hypothetical protein